MAPDLHDVCCASIPCAGLGTLAELRCHPDLRVILVDELAWLLWSKGQPEVLRRILSVPGVESYVERAGLWYRLHGHLPVFDLPIDRAARPLSHVLTPAPLAPLPPARPALSPLRLRLVPRGALAQTTGMLCTLGDLARWSETMPAGRLETLQVARLDESILVLGRRLPALPSSERLWGKSMLVPLGMRVEPPLPENELREVLGLRPEEIGLLRAEGIEAIARDVFTPLTRAGLRLACQELVHGS